MTVPTQKQGIPLASTPLLNKDGTMNIVWYRFFQSIHSITGLWALPITQHGSASTYLNPLIMYRKGGGFGALRVFDPAFPQSFTHGGTIVLTAP